MKNYIFVRTVAKRTKRWYNMDVMESYLAQLNEYFCENYCNYAKITAIDGYVKPEIITIDKDSNLVRRDEALMRLCDQEKKAELLTRFQNSLVDSEITFSFGCIPLLQRIKNFFSSDVFYKKLPEILKKYGETVQSVGEKLDIAPRIYQGIVRGEFSPEKNVVFAIALVCRMRAEDVEELLRLSGKYFDYTVVRDVVVGYLIKAQIFNEDMISRALALYSINTLPLKYEKNA